MIVTVNGSLDGPQDEEGVMTSISPILHLMRRCNSFFLQGLVSVQGECRPLVVCGHCVGVVRPDVACALLDYPQVFTPTNEAFILNSQLDSYSKRSNAVELVLRDLRAKNVLQALRGWREECFNVWADVGAEPLFQMERSAVTLLGVRAFGVHITGYTRSREDGRMRIWVQKRSLDKPTYPGMMDTMVGGGITAGLQPHQVMLKEAHEEAAVPEYLAKTARPAGSVSFFTESERGLHANTEFVYDLELPSDFVPHNNDGEVDSFEAVTVEEYLEWVISSKYKLTSVPIAIDFLVRHGFITPETELQYPTLLEMLHVPLDHILRTWPRHNHCPPLTPPPALTPPPTFTPPSTSPQVVIVSDV
ncbi:hypothetical protein Pcinc_022897 [Petrolisthes cinctipes]|uniref:Nudix hydrolase domain-containing protein n=1 Tax=Petrolisthes cinctipes TaxID=88211 RepID=A0AAE1FDB6_PETCI|nr:hypothetical protein Pcinc_022897 [Petrolisthes cinctipes]